MMMGIRAPALAIGLSIGTAGQVWAQAQTLPPPPTPTGPTTGAPPASTTPQGQPAAEPPPSGQVAEIVVTAQKRSENLQNVPIAITAITADKLASANVTSTATLQAVTPAITFSDVNGFLEPRIRGIGSSSAGAAVENSVATYIDGVYIASAPGSLLDLSTVERVEVLKGPQGTLFGRNATGGLVSIITRDPKFSFSGQADAGYGNYDTSRVDAYVTGPITSNLAADLTISASHQGDGYGTNFTTGKDTDKTDKSIAARSKFLLHLGDATTVHLSLDFSQVYGRDPTIAALSGAPNINNRNAAGVPIVLFHDPHDTYANNDASHKLLTGGVTLRIDQKVGDYTLSSITAGRRSSFGQAFDADAGPQPVIYETFEQLDQEVSQEFQIASPQSGRFTWIAGAYYYNLDSNFDPFILITGRPNPVQANSVLRNFLDNESIAGYAQGTLQLGFDTSFTGGFRYTDEKRSQQATTVATAATGRQTTTLVPYESFSENTPTWRLSLEHKFTPAILGYVSWNRGFKSGGYNSSVPTAPAYLPEKLDAYEAGAKSTLFDHRLRLNGAFFYYDYTNIQVNTYIGSLGVIYNGARAENYGIDFDFDYVIVPGLTLSGGADIIHDRFTSFPAAQIARLQPNGTLVVSPGSATGNRLPFAPDATFNIGIDYKHPLFGGNVDLFVNELYNSGFFTQADNVLQQGDYNLVNMSATWRPAGDRYFVKVYMNNALDYDIKEYFAVANGGASVSYQAPRTFGAQVGVKF